MMPLKWRIETPIWTVDQEVLENIGIILKNQLNAVIQELGGRLEQKWNLINLDYLSVSEIWSRAS